mgnify:CR=1
KIYLSISNDEKNTKNGKKIILIKIFNEGLFLKLNM